MITKWARRCLDRRKAAKEKAEVAATLDHILSQLPPEEAEALARKMMAHIAASFRAPASGSLAEMPQVIYFNILFTADSDQTNVHPAPQPASVSRGAEFSALALSPDAQGPADQVTSDRLLT